MTVITAPVALEDPDLLPVVAGVEPERPEPEMPSARWHPTMVLISTEDDDAAERARAHIKMIPILTAVLRRVAPMLVEATLIPALLVYLFLALGNLVLAMAAALTWCFGVLTWRRVTNRHISGVLVLGAMGLTVRTVVALAAGSALVYFFQPIATTLVLAAVFLASLLSNRPIIARLAGDFCPIAPDVAKRPAIIRLFRDLTIVWAMVHVATATTTFTLLVSLPTASYVATKTVACIAISTCAIVITVGRAVHIAKREGLSFAPAATIPDAA